MTDKLEVLALIPARGGSQSVPRKNILPVNGRPLIAYSILQGLNSHAITRTIVSTDDDEIAEIASHWGADVPFRRPPEFAENHSPDIDVFRHALAWLHEHEGYRPDLVVHLRPTGPVRRIEIIDRAIALMTENMDADALRSVALADQTPYKMWHFDGPFIEPVVRLPSMPEAHSMARQLLPKAYWQNGYVDIVRPRTILDKNSMVGDVVLGLIIDEPTFDIDYPEDIARVEEGLRHLEQGLSLKDGKRTRDRHPV